MSGLPGASGAHVEERKVREYLLNLAHPSGGSKARFFRARGFSPEDWRAFARALVLHGQQNAVVYTEMTAFRATYEVRCKLRSPDGTVPCIRTVWQAQEAGGPRLITAYPAG